MARQASGNGWEGMIHREHRGQRRRAGLAEEAFLRSLGRSLDGRFFSLCEIGEIGGDGFLGLGPRRRASGHGLDGFLFGQS